MSASQARVRRVQAGVSRVPARKGGCEAGVRRALPFKPFSPVSVVAFAPQSHRGHRPGALYSETPSRGDVLRGTQLDAHLPIGVRGPEKLATTGLTATGSRGRSLSAGPREGDSKVYQSARLLGRRSGNRGIFRQELYRFAVCSGHINGTQEDGPVRLLQLQRLDAQKADARFLVGRIVAVQRANG